MENVVNREEDRDFVRRAVEAAIRIALIAALAWWCLAIVVSASDAFLKPLFLGRGMVIPMPVILLGAIGGMVLSGIVGLFIGAVVLALGYQLMMAWMKDGSADASATADWASLPHE